MVIFIDIDGVLNQLQYGYYIDTKCVKVLADLVTSINGEIVLTSSWRLGYFHNFAMCSQQIKDLLMIFEKYRIRTRVIGRTQSCGDRATEVYQYLTSHRCTNYLIIDDDKSEFNPSRVKQFGLKNLYFVNAKTGLTQNDLKKIKKILK